MVTIKKQQVNEFNYQITLSQHEMEVLHVVLGEATSYKIYERMEDYGYEIIEDEDIPYYLFKTVKNAIED